MAEVEEGIIIAKQVHVGTGPYTVTSDDIKVDRQHKGFSFFFTGDQDVELHLDLFLFGAWVLDGDENTVDFLGDGKLHQWVFDNNKIPDDKSGEDIKARIRMVCATTDTNAGVFFSIHDKRK